MNFQQNDIHSLDPPLKPTKLQCANTKHAFVIIIPIKIYGHQIKTATIITHNKKAKLIKKLYIFMTHPLTKRQQQQTAAAAAVTTTAATSTIQHNRTIK